MWSGRSGKVCFGGKRLFETDVGVYSTYVKQSAGEHVYPIHRSCGYISIATTVPRWPMILLGAIQGCRCHVALL